MKTININGSNYTVEELTKILEEAKKVPPMQKVYEYHGTTQEEFEKLYEKLPLNSKYHQKEVMIVNFYNQGEKPDFKNTNQRKYYPYFEMDKFLFFDVSWYGSITNFPASLCFVGENAEENLREAVEIYFEEFKLSRTTLL